MPRRRATTGTSSRSARPGLLQACDVPQTVRDRTQLAFVYGDAGALLHVRSARHPGDLLVLGTQRRSGLLIGSVAQRILEQAENDVLLVPPGGV